MMHVLCLRPGELTAPVCGLSTLENCLPLFLCGLFGSLIYLFIHSEIFTGTEEMQQQETLVSRGPELSLIPGTHIR